MFDFNLFDVRTIKVAIKWAFCLVRYVTFKIVTGNKRVWKISTQSNSGKLIKFNFQTANRKFLSITNLINVLASYQKTRTNYIYYI